MGNDTIDLAGVWGLTDEDGAYDLSITLPGDVHSALIHQGVLDDPFFGRNELEVQWVGQRGWTMTRNFVLPEAAPLSHEDGPRWILTIDTVDCTGTIRVNGSEVWQGTNMFVPVRVDVTSAVQAGSNSISVALDSAEKLALQRSEALPYPVPFNGYPVQSPHRNLVRKVQCHSGWDWGPALMVAGLYGRIALTREVAWAPVNSRGVPRPVDPEHLDGTWLLPVTVELDTPLPPQQVVQGIEVRLLDPTGEEVARAGGAHLLPQDPCSLFPDRAAVQVDLLVQQPQLWWPAGYGAQPLYTVEVIVPQASPLQFTTAFRTIEVVSEKDTHGRSMFFRVNGRDVWAKGANWIPLDALPSRQTVQRCRQHLEAAAAAHMNMIRVWGGGQYEPDHFYQICDELGLMVWQDFMFSCSLYPSQEWFLQEVRLEVAVQVRRLMSHPCIAIWCGNNEDIGALGWYPESRENPGRYLIDYDRLNSGVIGAGVRALDDTRVFWPSSPAAGEGDFSDNFHDDTSGDMHYWSVWHEGKSFDGYQEVTPRFCSEFGFQSFPSLHSIRTFTPPSQFNPTAPDLEHHQRHPRGNTVVTETMTRYFRLPFDFENFLYLSQVQQALAIRTAVDFWRSRRPVSMGALYWQLNDLWPVVSWSSLEYDGRWKLLHYEARRFFAPLRLVCQVYQTQQEVWLSNDTDREVRGSVLLQWLGWDGTVRRERRVEVSAASDTATLVERSDLAGTGEQEFLLATWEGDGHTTVERGWTFLTEPKRCELQMPGLTVSATGSAAGSAGCGTVEVACAGAPAFWVTLEARDPALRFGDNGFLMLPGETHRVSVTGAAGDDHRRWDVDEITCRHLRGTW